MKKNAFTLIELLGVLLLLAIIALITFPIIDKTLTSAKEEAYNRQKDNIIEAARMYVTENGNYDTNQKQLSFQTLIDAGFLKDGDILDPRDSNKKMPGCILYNWSNSSNQYIYEYSEECILTEPSIPESVSFAKDSWETIAAIVKAGKAEETYNVGDEKEVTLAGTYAGTYTVRIANNSTPSECSTEGFSQTACGFVVEFVDIITTHNMNSTSTNSGGWPASEMYSFVNTDIYNTLPSDLQNIIIDTYSVSGHGNQSGATNFTSTDKLYLLSTKEVWGKDGTSNTIIYDSAEAETRQLDYYKNNGVTTDSYSGAVKTYQGSAKHWWLRAARSNNSGTFYIVNASGDWYTSIAYSSYGVAPAFRIG